MKKLLILLATIACVRAEAITPTDLQSIPTVNQLLSNGGFENSTAGWTKSAGTLVSQTATKQPPGKAAGQWTLSSATGTLSQDVATPGLQNMEAFCYVNSTASTFQVCGRVGGTSTGCTAVPSTGNWTKVSAPNFSALASGTVGIEVSTTSATTGSVYVDQCYVGPTTSVSQIGQASLVASARIPQTASCDWLSSSSSYVEFAANGNCPSTMTVDYNPGPAAVNPSYGTKPQIVFNDLPAGVYDVEISLFVYSTSAGFNSGFAISDGTTTGGYQFINSASGSDVQNRVLHMQFAYTSGGPRTFKVVALAQSGSSAQIVNGGGIGGGVLTEVKFKVSRYALASESALTPATSAFVWSGYHDNTCSWGVTTTSVADFGNDASCALVQKENVNAGTVTTSSGTKPGIIFTPSSTGRYEVCADTSIQGASANTATLVLKDITANARLSDDTRAISTDRGNFHVCGYVNVTSIGSAREVRLQLGSDASVANTMAQYAEMEGAVQWRVRKVTQGIPQPVVLGNVQTPSASRTFMYASAYFESDCSIRRQYGSPNGGNWITLNSGSSTGSGCNYTLSGFTSPPNCTTGNIQGGNGQIVQCDPDNSASSMSCIVVLGNGSGSAVKGQVSCHGPTN